MCAQVNNLFQLSRPILPSSFLVRGSLQSSSTSLTDSRMSAKDKLSRLRRVGKMRPPRPQRTICRRRSNR
jgi:hypothetical protein